jgi:hypothetical protein
VSLALRDRAHVVCLRPAVRSRVVEGRKPRWRVYSFFFFGAR